MLWPTVLPPKKRPQRARRPGEQGPSPAEQAEAATRDVRKGADGQWQAVGALAESERVRRYKLANRPFELIDVGKVTPHPAPGTRPPATIHHAILRCAIRPPLRAPWRASLTKLTKPFLGGPFLSVSSLGGVSLPPFNLLVSLINHACGGTAAPGLRRLRFGATARREAEGAEPGAEPGGSKPRGQPAHRRLRVPVAAGRQ